MFFRRLWRFWAKGGCSDFCNSSQVKSIKFDARWLISSALFLGAPFFAVSAFFDVISFDAEKGSGLDFGGSEISAGKRFSGECQEI